MFRKRISSRRVPPRAIYICLCIATVRIWSFRINYDSYVFDPIAIICICIARTNIDNRDDRMSTGVKALRDISNQIVQDTDNLHDTPFRPRNTNNHPQKKKAVFTCLNYWFGSIRTVNNRAMRLSEREASESRGRFGLFLFVKMFKKRWVFSHKDTIEVLHPASPRTKQIAACALPFSGGTWRRIIMPYTA